MAVARYFGKFSFRYIDQKDMYLFYYWSLNRPVYVYVNAWLLLFCYLCIIIEMTVHTFSVMCIKHYKMVYDFI